MTTEEVSKIDQLIEDYQLRIKYAGINGNGKYCHPIVAGEIKSKIRAYIEFIEDLKKLKE